MRNKTQNNAYKIKYKIMKSQFSDRILIRFSTLSVILQYIMRVVTKNQI